MAWVFNEQSSKVAQRIKVDLDLEATAKRKAKSRVCYVFVCARFRTRPAFTVMRGVTVADAEAEEHWSRSQNLELRTVLDAHGPSLQSKRTNKTADASREYQVRRRQ